MAPPPVDQYQRHVAALAFPFSSHASSLLATIHRLATALPNTVFSFISTSQSNNSLFSNTNVSLPRNIKVYDVADGVPEGYVFAGQPQEAIELFMHAAPVNLKRTLEASVANMGKPVCCLITDAFLWFGAHLADDMGATWVSFWIAGLNSLSVHVHTDLIRQTVGTHSTAGRENELIAEYVNIPGLSTIRIKDLQEGVVFGNLDSVFSRMLLQMGRMLPRATAVFIDCLEELDSETANDLKSKLNKLLNVGPSIVASPPSPKAVDATAGCLAWLGKQDAASVVYIGFGTVAKPSDVELMEIAEALETTETPFLWSIKESFKTPLLNEFLKTRLSKLNGMVVPWAPQPHVLAHAAVGAFVTHAGWHSMLEAIAGGVPLICRPFFADQRLNARMAEAQLEIGVIVEGGVFTKTGLVKALELVLSTQRGNKMRDNTKPIKQLAQQAVGPDGSSTRNFNSLLDVISGTNTV